MEFDAKAPDDAFRLMLTLSSANFETPADTNRSRCEAAVQTAHIGSVLGLWRKDMPAALVVEDEPELASFACAVFSRVGLDAFAVESSAEAIDILENSWDIAVLLINLTGERDELDLAKTVASRWPAIRLILVTDRLASLRELPPVVFLSKPTTSMALMAIVEQIVRATSPPFGPRGGHLC